MSEWALYDAWEHLQPKGRLMAELSPETRDAVREGAKMSAAAVLPIVFEHLRGWRTLPSYAPEAILDVGTGEGHWLDAASALGVKRVWGVDIEAEASEYRWNAEEGTPLPVYGYVESAEQRGDEIHVVGENRRWPLTLCLETAEHVSPAAGGHLVAELCRVSERILWSAAIPGQGGDGHVNEQWPRYWSERFNDSGFVLVDPYRDQLWECADVEPWYRQNLLLGIPVAEVDPVGIPHPRSLVDPVTWAHHRGVPAPGQ